MAEDNQAAAAAAEEPEVTWKLKTRAMRLNLSNGKIYTTLKMYKNHMEISMSPKKLNTIPSIAYKDIDKAEQKIAVSPYFAIMAVLSIIAACLGQLYCLLFTALFIYFSICYKLVIHASVGLSTMITNIYVPKKKVANEILEQINKYKISAEKEQTADIK